MEDPSVVLLSIIVTVFSVPGSIASVVSVLYGVQRVRLYPEPGSARRLYAQFMLFNSASICLCLACFLAVGVAMLAMDDTPVRGMATRVLLITPIVALSVMAVVNLIGYSYVEAASDRAREKVVEEVREEVRDERDDRHDSRTTGQNRRQTGQNKRQAGQDAREIRQDKREQLSDERETERSPEREGRDG